jgi:hypothetical protein
VYPLDHVDEMLELAIEMRRNRARREHPDASDAEIDALVRTWLHDRPGAPFGDAEGRPGVWPRQ